MIPGLFVAILLRFDAHRAKIKAMTAHHASFSKTYFHVNILAYAAGLVCTVWVMYYFKAAQPALLYLVPACLGSSLFQSLIRGELTELLAYDEEVKKEEVKKEEGGATAAVAAEVAAVNADKVVKGKKAKKNE